METPGSTGPERAARTLPRNPDSVAQCGAPPARMPPYGLGTASRRARTQTERTGSAPPVPATPFRRRARTWVREPVSPGSGHSPSSGGPDPGRQATRPEHALEQGGAALEVQQPLLAVQTAAVPREAAVRADYAVAGH